MAINNTAAILQNNAAMFQGANSRIFDAITQASEAYEARRRSRDAAIEAERQRQADIKAAEQVIALDPEKAIMREAMARGVDPKSVTPEMRAAAAAGKDFLSSKVLADQFGRPYKPYNFGAADMMAPVVQAENLPPANATADMMAPLPAPTFTSPSGGLLPPPAALSAGETRMVMPSPVGEPEVKRSAIAGVKPPKMIQGAAGPIPDPVDQKRYEAELAVATEADKGGAKAQADKKVQRFNDTKSVKGLMMEITNLNDKIDTAVKQSNFLNTGRFAGKSGEGEARRTTGEGILGSGYLTGGVDLAQTLETVKSDAALGKLAEMKANSETGASGLGATNIAEFSKLETARQSVEQSQTQGQLDSNLKKYKAIRLEVLRNTMDAYKKQYGEYPEGYNPKQFIDTSSIPQGAIDKLKSDPKLRDAFDAKYGAGAANKALGR